MKLGEILDRLDSPMDNFFNGSEMIEELGLSGYANLERHGFTSRPITVWNCTDTWVGRTAIYLDGELVAVSDQECRKCGIDWEWASQAAYDRVHAVVRDALRQEDDLPKISLINRDAEIGEPYYQLGYAGEVLWHLHHKTALYHGRKVKVLGVGDRDYLCKSVKIQDQDHQSVVPLHEIRFPVPLRPIE